MLKKTVLSGLTRSTLIIQPDLKWLMKKIEDSGTVFCLNSDEVTELRKQGVEARVVDYMMETYVEHSILPILNSNFHKLSSIFKSHMP